MIYCPRCLREFEGQSIGSHARICKPTEPELFWVLVDRESDGCWEWKGARHKDGYGRFNAKTGMVIAHRYAWTLGNGAIPPGMDIGHTCDNRGCVKPSHLYLCTPAENMRDMYLRGRQPSKLKLSDIQEIRRILSTNPPRGTQARLAREYGVSEGVISNIKNPRTWKHAA